MRWITLLQFQAVCKHVFHRHEFDPWTHRLTPESLNRPACYLRRAAAAQEQRRDNRFVAVYHIQMLAGTPAGIASKLPSSVKYRMGKLEPLYTRAMFLGQSSTIVETSIGQLQWQIDAFTSRESLRGTYEPYMQNTFLKYVLPGNTVFDVGAHAGFHSLSVVFWLGLRAGGSSTMDGGNLATTKRTVWLVRTGSLPQLDSLSEVNRDNNRRAPGRARAQ